MVEHTCGLYILNRDNELLITHPTLSKKTSNWSIPKGKPNEGENDWEAAIREVKEETNLDIIKVNEFMQLQDSTYRSRKKVLHSFYVKINDFSSETAVSCDSYFEYQGKQLPENDLHMWVNIFDPKLDMLLHESQISNLNIIRNFKLT